MVDEKELVSRLREILSDSDLNTTSAGAVRRQLESHFGVDLSDRKKFISQLIDDIIQEPNTNTNTNTDTDTNPEEDKVEDEAELEHQHDQQDHATNSQSKNRSNSSTSEEEEEEEEEVEEAPKKKKRGTGFTRICDLSPQLQQFLGVQHMARTEVVKKLWAYIRENDLQDPNNRRNIKCDPALHSIFRVNTINMFQMNKVLSKHIWPLDTANANECSVSLPDKDKPLDDTVSDVDVDVDVDVHLEKPKRKRHKQDDDTDEDKPKRKAKQQKGATSGFLKPLKLSEAFTEFLGTGENTLSRAEAVKRIWQYIKLNDLQDPSDKRRILCDSKLKELFEVDTFHGFSVTKYLTAHLSKAEQ